MKFCYLDESGTGTEPVAVMAGVVVDATRMHLTKRQWQQQLVELSNLAGRELEEVHTKDLYPGNGRWRGTTGEVRSSIIDNVIEWLSNRRHKIIFSAVDRSLFDESYGNEAWREDVPTLWRFLGTHIVLGLQKAHQSSRNNKGHTLMVFDNQHMERPHFRKLLFDPPTWTDSFYARNRRQEQLDQIIDVPFFGDSKQVGLVQVADFVAYFIRRHIELQDGKTQPSYEGEIEKVERWFDLMRPSLLPISNMYKKRGRDECEDFFFRYSPEFVRNM